MNKEKEGFILFQKKYMQKKEIKTRFSAINTKNFAGESKMQKSPNTNMMEYGYMNRREKKAKKGSASVIMVP